jgi:hypothetical protein
MGEYTNPLTDYTPQLETSAAGLPGMRNGHFEGSFFEEEEELNLASELMEVSSERDLDRYVDRLVGRALEATGTDLPEPVERDLGGFFKKLAKAVVPVIGGGLGFLAGGPPGAALGSALASTAGHALGLELEGLSPEDAEFEASRQFVRFAGAAVSNARGAGSTRQARDAVLQAARAHAPGFVDLLDGAPTGAPTDPPSQAARSFFPQSPNGGTQMDATDRGRSAAARSYGNGRQTSQAQALSEDEQMDFASRLMETETEEEFENWLGGLLSRGLQAAGKALDSSAGHAVIGALKDAAKSVLPDAAQAIGSALAGPTGGQIGRDLGAAATNLFEAEAEAEEREWEAANVLVRVALDVANRAADAPPNAHPQDVAHHAVAEALRRHAPEAVHIFSAHREGGSHRGRRRHHTGHWVRHGHTIIVHGL